MLFEPHNLNISYDITTYCNAKCPQCHRTNKNGLARNERVPLVHVPKEKIFRTFTPDLLSRINHKATHPAPAAPDRPHRARRDRPKTVPR